MHDKKTGMNKGLEHQDQEFTSQSDLSLSILNSLDSHIAVLDRDGEIIAINESWRQFAKVNGADSLEKVGVGANYLDTCRFDATDDAERAIAGIRSVLDDTKDRFDLEYPFHGPSERRWLSMRVTPLSTKQGGAVVAHTEITARKQAEQQLLAYQERLRTLASELTVTEEKERRRIATQLHDGAAQSLAFARILLASARKTGAGTARAQKLDEVSQILRETLKQIRGVMLDLSSPSMNEIGLAAAISEWLEEIGRRYDFRTSFTENCDELFLTDDLGAMLFRNTRELLMNAAKHSKADNVSVHLESSEQALRITVEDDGIGFEPDSVAHSPGDDAGFGLFSIREHMTELDGSLEVVSSPGKGCRATLITPLQSAP